MMVVPKKRNSEQRVEVEAQISAFLQNEINVTYIDGKRDTEDTDLSRPGRVRIEFQNNDLFVGNVVKTGGIEGFVKSGPGIYTWANSAKYEGSYQRDKKHGYGRYQAANGEVYEGYFEYGIKSGKGTYKYADGTLFSGNWFNAQRHGKGVFFFNDGSSQVVEYETGEVVDLASLRDTRLSDSSGLPLALAIIGAPASGKTTQAKRLCKAFDLVYVRLEDLIIEAADLSSIGNDVQRYFILYDEFSDELMVELIYKRVNRNDAREHGFLLVDFPRTAEQAKMLSEKGVHIDNFINIKVAEEVSHKRAQGRRFDPETKESFHLEFRRPPAEIEERLIVIAKDKSASVLKRIEEYKSNLNSVVNFYDDKVIHVDGEPEEDAVLKQIRSGLYKSEHPFGIIVAGAPGSGKGTQSKRIRERHGLVHLSSGDLLRAEVKAGTEAGVKAKAYMDEGRLVPAELIVKIIKKRLQQDDVKENGFLLDGFPRQLEEAKALDEMGVNIDLYLVLNVPEKKLMDRVIGRKIDPETGDSYHDKHNPAPKEIRRRLVTRPDDTKEKLMRRLKTYNENITSIKIHFSETLHEVNGAVHIEKVKEQIERAVTKTLKKKIKQNNDF